MTETATPSANVRRSATRRANAKARKLELKQPEPALAEHWFVGSNGNLFCDAGGYRYCIARDGDQDYSVARNGVEIGRATSETEGSHIVAADCRPKHVTEECGPDCLSICWVCS